MSCQDVSEMGDRPHALGGCPNTSDGRIAQRLTYLGKHRAFRWASICRLQAVDGCVPQMNRGGFITGHEQMDEEGSARYRWCSSLAQSPKHPDGNAIARIARPVQHSRALLAGLLAASAAAEAAITAVVMRPIFARHADVRDDLRFRRRTQLQSGLLITIWPYSPFTDTAPMDVRSDPERSSSFTTRHCNVLLVQWWAGPQGTRNTAGFQLCCDMPCDSQWLPL
jgi:hypothetical protein